MSRTKHVTKKQRAKVSTKPQGGGDSFLEETEVPNRKVTNRIKMLSNGLVFDPKKYVYNEDFVEAKEPVEAHTTFEMVKFMEADSKIQVDARIIGMDGKGNPSMVRMGRDSFIECAKRRDSKKLRETMDYFAYGEGGPTSGLIGNDFTPLMGGPFYKQLYYRDYLRMIAASFYAFHHDPAARDVVSIMTDFTMGRGFQVTAKGKDKEKAQLIWDAFAKVNDLESQFDSCGEELSIYGESMWWELPDNQVRIDFNTGWKAKDDVPRGLLPRFRLIDPSNIAEIITVPEDIVKGVIAYVWMASTQYQMFTDGKQPTTKYIYTQIPANQISHFKINSVSNEKRGRSDYFPALGFMKRLRDSVNYALIAQQKNAAWCIDTTVQGDETDLDNYVASQRQLGTIPSAGSEFVHTDAIKREYLASQGTGKSTDSPTFAWCMSNICMATGIPLSYFGTHLSNATNRAGALISTEPVAKKFERRQTVYKKMVCNMFDKVMRKFKLNADCDVQFPELITQDRSAYIRDLTLAENNKWISHETAAKTAAKEFGLKDYDYRAEQAKLKSEGEEEVAPPSTTNPLTTPGKNGQTGKSNGAMTTPEKKQVKDNMRNI